MKVYLGSSYRSGPAEIIKVIESDEAVPWKEDESDARWYSDIHIGNTRIFIVPSETRTDGYELTEKDLKSLLRELRRRK